MVDRLLDRLIERFPGAKRGTLRDMLRDGRVRVNGEPARSLAAELSPDDVVTVGDAEPRRYELAQGLVVLHADPDVFVVDKPAGLITITDKQERRPTVAAILAAHAAEKNYKQKIHRVHRLDKDASGVLVFARSEPAYRRLRAQFEVHSITRQYEAVIHGELSPARGRLEHRLAEGEDGIVRPVDAKTHGKDARLDYEMLTTDGERSHVRVTLHTGRRHQIRAQLSTVGHPICGDRLYGTEAARASGEPPGRLALHAVRLAFEHPRSGRRLDFASPAPGAFAALVRGERRRAAPEPKPAAARGPERKPAPDAGWNEVASWYDELVGDEGQDYHREVVIPGVLRLLEARPGESVLDVACGQGVVARAIAERGARVVGVDLAPALVEAARRRTVPDAGIDFRVGDARRLGEVTEAQGFDAAVCVLAIQNLAPLAPVFEGLARALRPRGRAVVVMMHPSFRVPRGSSWIWDEHEAAQFRRVDRYLSSFRADIQIRPGADPGAVAPSHHRPLETYVNGLGSAGLLVERLEEWPSHRTSPAGPRKKALDRSRDEIPLFLALRARRL